MCSCGRWCSCYEQGYKAGYVDATLGFSPIVPISSSDYLLRQMQRDAEDMAIARNLTPKFPLFGMSDDDSRGSVGIVHEDPEPFHRYIPDHYREQCHLPPIVNPDWEKWHARNHPNRFGI